MPEKQTLEVKRGPQYWEMVEKTAQLVESWPDWKKGEPSTVQQVPSSDTTAEGSRAAGAAAAPGGE